MADNLFDDIFGWLKPKSESTGARQRRLESQGAWAAMPAKNNLSNWMAGGTVSREREEMRAAMRDDIDKCVGKRVTDANMTCVRNAETADKIDKCLR